MPKVGTVIRTVVYLKPIQFFYQVYYRLFKQSDKVFDFTPKCQVVTLNWNYIIDSETIVTNNSFTFLNKSITLIDLDWNYSDFGKLWCYNLNYFDFLRQKNLNLNSKMEFIDSFCQSYSSIEDGKEPYPTSLRLINWVKFFAINKDCMSGDIQNVMWQDAQRLSQRLEYHLLANHLLENGFGLLFASYQFKNDRLYKLAKKIIETQLNEQILSDGGHYERSAMYHNIILLRVLDSIQLIKLNSWKKGELINLLKSKASLMLSWIKKMRFEENGLPPFNDMARGIAPEYNDLIAYKDYLSIKVQDVKLSESGYRSFSSEAYHVICDVSQITPKYQPGHHHADSLHYVLEVDNKAILVEAGTKTYESSDRRSYERSTHAHNTVTIEGQSSSEVWSSFRVGRRAKVTILQDSDNTLVAYHDGYKHLGVIHERTWETFNTKLIVKDKLNCDKKLNSLGISRLHLHPEVQLNTIDDKRFKLDQIQLNIKGKILDIAQSHYEYAYEFNKSNIAICLEVQFKDSIEFEFNF